MAYRLRLTVEFQTWLDGLSDRRAQVRIAARLRRAELGNLGDWRALGGKVSEMRIDTGPGYRLYFTGRGGRMIVMLIGGDKSTQRQDIAQARRVAAELEERS